MRKYGMLFVILALSCPLVSQADINVNEGSTLRIKAGGKLDIRKNGMLRYTSGDVRDALRIASRQMSNLVGRIEQIGEWYVIKVKRSPKSVFDPLEKNRSYDMYNLLLSPMLVNDELSDWAGRKVRLKGVATFVRNHRTWDEEDEGWRRRTVNNRIYNFTVTKIRRAH